MNLSKIVLGVCCVLILGACGGDQDDSEVEQEATTAATSMPGTAAPATVEEGDDDPPLILASSVTSMVFAPTITLTLGENWRLVEDSAAAFFVEHDVEEAAGQAFIGFVDVTTVRNPIDYSVEPAPADVLQWLIDHRDATVLDGPNSVMVGGRPATEIEVSFLAGNVIPLFNDFTTESYRDRLRFVQIDVDGDRVLMVAGAFEWPKFEEVVPLIDEIMSSVIIE